jgi:vancomycin resistance protein YoaR
VHAAAFFAGLAVEEYHAHSRLNRFAYLPPGLDAMVAWPDSARDLRETKDLRLRNPYPFPVSIEVKTERTPDRNVLRVKLFGAAKPFRVDFGFEILQRVAAPEVRRSDPVLASGDVRVQQEAFDGMLIARRRTVYTPLRKIEEETLITYPPTPRIVLFGTASRELRLR